MYRELRFVLLYVVYICYTFVIWCYTYVILGCDLHKEFLMLDSVIYCQTPFNECCRIGYISFGFDLVEQCEKYLSTKTYYQLKYIPWKMQKK